MTTIYGIKNCDTMKKALNWLDEHAISYQFHDYKKQGLDGAAFKAAIQAHGWENAINRRGTTWRQLPDDIKSSMTPETVLKAAKDNPSLVKRPLLIHDGKVYLGFKDTQYANIFSTA